TPRKGDDCQLLLTRVPQAKRAGFEETKVDSGQVTSDIDSKFCSCVSRQWKFKMSRRCQMMSLTVAKFYLLNRPFSSVHGTRRRGLALFDHCKLPLPRASRAKQAGPEAAEIYSSQAMSVNLFAQQSDCTCIRSLLIAVVHGTTQRGLALVVSEAAET
ncbi:hypothetical protein TYRP_000724, partial [Tyrophagus putrescentiae]